MHSVASRLFFMTNRKVVTSFFILLAAIIGFWVGVVMRLVRMGTPKLPSGPALLAQFDDVGAGDAAIFTSPSGLTVLVDAGSDDNGAGEIVSQLHRLKADAPTIIVLTSTRSRSIGGLPYLLSHTDFHGPIVLPCEPAEFSRLGGAAAQDAVSAAGRSHVPLVSEASYESAPDHVLMSDSTTAMTLIPVQEQGLRAHRVNGAPQVETVALAVRVDYGQRSVLYAAGLTPTQEDELIALRVRLPCDVLAVSDGGGVDSTSSELLALAGPRYATISTSADAPPDPETLDRISAAGATTDRTDLIGTLTLAIGADPANPITLFGPQATLPASSSTHETTVTR